MKRNVLALLFCLCASQLHATVTLSLREAEQRALETSWRLRAAQRDIVSADHQANAGFTALLPKLSVQGNYTFLSTLPQVSFGGAPAVTFGDHNNYNLGLGLNYTLWDTFSSLKNFQALKKVKEARSEDQKATEVQLLFSVRVAYVRLQLALEELTLVKASLELARSQERDVNVRFSNGAATYLERLVSKRQVSAFQMQHEQKSAEVAAAQTDLLSLIGVDALGHSPRTRLQLDNLKHTLDRWSEQAWPEGPASTQPQIKSLDLLRQSAELTAESLKGKLFPSLQLSVSTALVYPNGPQLVNVNQNTIALSLSVPLYLGDPTWHLVDQRRSEANALSYRARQLKQDLTRDFDKATQLVADLKTQRALAEQDVEDSAQIAKLYYSSYLAGRGTLTDVQAANNALLQSRVNAARINAQLCNQYIHLTALLGQEGTHG